MALDFFQAATRLHACPVTWTAAILLSGSAGIVEDYNSRTCLVLCCTAALLPNAGPTAAANSNACEAVRKALLHPGVYAVTGTARLSAQSVQQHVEQHC